MTQTQLAEYYGVTVKTIYAYKNGEIEKQRLYKAMEEGYNTIQHGDIEELDTSTLLKYQSALSEKIERLSEKIEKVSIIISKRFKRIY